VLTHTHTITSAGTSTEDTLYIIYMYANTPIYIYEYAYIFTTASYPTRDTRKTALKSVATTAWHDTFADSIIAAAAAHTPHYHTYKPYTYTHI